MLTVCLEKLLKNKIDSITVMIKISSNANILKGLNMKEKELFSTNFEASSDDLKTSLSSKEFKREVVAAIKSAPSTKVFNFNFRELNRLGRLAGCLKLDSNNCLNSICSQAPELKVIRMTGIK